MKADRILSALLAITLALVGVVYSSVTTRIEAVEAERKPMEQVARDVAVVKAQVENLQQSVNAANAKIDALTDKLATVMAVVSSNRKDYQRALDEWDAANAQRKAKR